MKKIMMLLLVLILFSCDNKKILLMENNQKEKEEITVVYKDYMKLHIDGLNLDTGRLTRPEYNKREASSLKLKSKTFLNKLEKIEFKNEEYKEILNEIILATEYIENFSEYLESNTEFIMSTDYIDVAFENSKKISELLRKAGLEID